MEGERDTERQTQTERVEERAGARRSGLPAIEHELRQLCAAKVGSAHSPKVPLRFPHASHSGACLSYNMSMNGVWVLG